MTDQQRGDCLGVDGHPCLLTPNLDALAAEGVRFRRAYSTSPVCIPARRSLMSGLHPRSHGMVGYEDGKEWEPEATLPQTLRDSGYHTGLVGRSMHLHPVRKRYGFEEMVISKGNGGDYDEFLRRHAPDAGGYYGAGIMHNDWTARPWPLSDHLHHTEWTVKEALRFLERRDPSRPWFLTVSFLAPHPPFLPPEFYLERYLRSELPEPLVGDWSEKPNFRGGAPAVNSHRVDLEGEVLRSCRAAYYGMINHIDDQIGRLRSRIDPQNTLIVFTSDHGEMLGDHYFFRKELPYEGASRIPFLIRMPGQCAEGRRGAVSEFPVCLEDLMPTILDAAGVEPPPGLDGRNLRAELVGAESSPEGRMLLIEIGGGERPFHALVDGKNKYIWFSRDGREQFFDLVEDPQELRDLIADPGSQSEIARFRAELVERLRDRPEGFVCGGKLVAGRPHSTMVPG